MFCPKCKAEYREGFTRCADCIIDLVENLDPINSAEQGGPETEPDFNFIELLSTFNEGDVVFVKSLLESEGIPLHHEGEYRIMSRRGNTPMRLFVPDYQLKQARELLSDFKEKFWGFETGSKSRK